VLLAGCVLPLCLEDLEEVLYQVRLLNEVLDSAVVRGDIVEQSQVAPKVIMEVTRERARPTETSVCLG